MNHIVVIEGHSYNPQKLIVAPGDSVVWENRDEVRHTATRKQDPAFDTGYISPGKSSLPVAFPVATEDEVEYFCAPHPFMRASILVQNLPVGVGFKEVSTKDAKNRDLLARKPDADFAKLAEEKIHLIKKGIICSTDYRPRARTPFEIVLDATDGFIPLWDQGLVLRWRFNSASFLALQQTELLQNKIRDLFSRAVLAWGDAAPIRFDENADNSDFEILMEEADSCSLQGCTIAQSFFPDSGRHQLLIFPKIFTEPDHEQVDSLTHELGHIFGLRHFFAPEFENRWPSVLFGEHKPFSIMNYGKNSELTEFDRNDLKKLYKAVWSKQLIDINGTPFKLIRPYHYLHS